MSRFDRGRWNRVVVWTGAALAWGSVFVATRLELGHAVPPTVSPVPAQAGVEVSAAFPAPPAGGIVVIRQSGSSVAPALVPAPSSAPAPGSAPMPVSSGS